MTIFIALLAIVACAAAQCTQMKDPRDPLRYYYDLNLLADNAFDYRMYVNADYTLRINVCRPLVAPLKLCDDTTGACLEHTLGTKNLFMGVATYDFSYVDAGRLEMRYMNRSVGLEPPTHAYTIISFHCIEAAGIGYPLFESYNGNVLRLQWLTEHACPKRIDSCIFTNGTGHVDLTSLGSTDYSVPIPTQTGATYYVRFNACRPLRAVYGGICPNGTYACLLTSSTSDEKRNVGRTQLLTMADGALTTVLTNGDLCGNFGTYSTVVIHFICASSNGGPQFLRESLCQYEFQWTTPLVCGN